MRRLATGLMLGVITLAGCGQSADDSTRAKLKAADTSFEQAQTTEDYVRVAAQYQEVVDDGFAAAAVFYNQGNAWAQADRRGYAIAAYLRAQQLTPRDTDLQANLEQTRKQVQQTTGADHTMGDVILFLTRYLSETELGRLATVILAIALWATLFAPGRFARRLAAAAWLGFAVLMLTLGFDWYQRTMSPRGVMTAQATAFQGPAESYDAAFSTPLEDGVEFRVLTEQDDWLNITIAGAGEGWVPRRCCELIR